MDIHRFNIFLDKFMKRLYDVDVYLTPSKYTSRDNVYDVNVLFFPSKFLKNSPDYSEKYYNFFNRSSRDIEFDISKAFKFFDVGTQITTTDNFNLKVPSKTSEYLQEYINELSYNINKFIETANIDDIDLSDKVSNIRVNRIDPVIYSYSDKEPYISLRLSHDSSFGDISPLLNDDTVRDRMIDYLETKMVLDPQIDFWFEQ